MCFGVDAPMSLSGSRCKDHVELSCAGQNPTFPRLVHNAVAPFLEVMKKRVRFFENPLCLFSSGWGQPLAISISLQYVSWVGHGGSLYQG